MSAKQCEKDYCDAVNELLLEDPEQSMTLADLGMLIPKASKKASSKRILAADGRFDVKESDCIVAGFLLRALFALLLLPLRIQERAVPATRCSFNHWTLFEYRFIGSKLVARGHHHRAQLQNRNDTKIKKNPQKLRAGAALQRSVPRRNGEVVRLITVVDGSLQHDDDGVAGGGLDRSVHRYNGEDGKWREKKLHFALDVALLHQVDVPAATPARLHDAQQHGTHWQHVHQRRLPFGIHANDPVHGGQAGVERHEPEPGATA